MGHLIGTYFDGASVKGSTIPSFLSLTCCTKGCSRGTPTRLPVRVRSACMHLSGDVTRLLRLVSQGINLGGALFFVASAKCTSTSPISPPRCGVPNKRFRVRHYSTLLGLCLTTVCNRKR